MRKLLAALSIALSAAVTITPPVSAEPGIEPAGAVDLPQGPAQAWLLADLDTGRILASRNPYEPHPPASTIKALLAMVVLDQLPLNAVIAAKPANADVECSCVGVKEGRAYTVRQLLDGLMLVSGNDAAIALAQHDSRTVGAFVRRMNRWRDRMGLRCTHFSTPSGILDQRNYSCPRDLAVLARADLANPWIRKVVATREVRFPFPVKGHYLDLYNNNPFIIDGMQGITGLKTGYTDAAGRCYVTTQRVDGHELGVVLLNTPNPLDQVPALLHAGARAEARLEARSG